MAKDEALFAQLFDLLGKRSDDPAIVAFHRERKLAAPPVAGKVDLAYDVPAKKLGFEMFYGAKVGARVLPAASREREARHVPRRHGLRREVRWRPSWRHPPRARGRRCQGSRVRAGRD